MFTGIIQAVGQIKRVTPFDDDAKLIIETNTLDISDVVIGDSIAVNGICL
ncbi:MAG: riboflavin synthase, partial [Nitrosomonadales bacterium]|nr:riboflavin synthase [Nitrosomonadales bacterium]